MMEKALIFTGILSLPAVCVLILGATKSPVDRPRAYLNMPTIADAAIPKQLSQTGAFEDVRLLTPTKGLTSYEVNVPLWSDGADKRRWIALPQGTSIHFTENGPWEFPAGTVFIKHFERPAGHRLETRLLVRDATGGVYGATYRWRPDNSDADLVDEPVLQPAADTTRQSWYFPGRADCRTCHTPVSGGVLGVSTRQLNRGATKTGENQILEFARLGRFDRVPSTVPSALPKLASLDNESMPPSDRARSYLDANCAYCHQPNGVAGHFDARFDTALSKQNLVNGSVMINLGLDHAKTIAPADVWRSIVLVRMETHDRTRMPPLAHELVDERATKVMRVWIASLPGKAVLPPPTIETKGGDFHDVVRVVISIGEAVKNDATIHYTLDGSLPLKSSPVYSGPIELHEPATVRARVFDETMTPSICVQETFIVNQ